MTIRRKLSVIGTGYLGVTHAVCMAELGYEVIGLDVDDVKIVGLSAGEVPFFEPGLPELLRKTLDAGRLSFTTSYQEVADFADVHFLCVGTPRSPAAPADLRHVESAVASLAPRLRPSALVVGKSTSSARAVAVLREVYAPILETGCPVVVTDFATAELVKVAANSFLATKISFINATGELCEVAGGDVMELSMALGYDPRIGPKFLHPGLEIRRGLSAEGHPRVHGARRGARGGQGAGLPVRGRLREFAVPRSSDPALCRRAGRLRRDAESVWEAAADAELTVVLTEWNDFRQICPEMLGNIVTSVTVAPGVWHSPVRAA